MDRRKTPERSPGFSRDKDLEDARNLGRPADADLGADERGADRRPDSHIDYAPDPDEPE